MLPVGFLEFAKSRDGDRKVLGHRRHGVFEVESLNFLRGEFEAVDEVLKPPEAPPLTVPALVELLLKTGTGKDPVRDEGRSGDGRARSC